MQDTDPRRRLGFRLRLRLARLFVSFERIYPAYWPALGVAIGFLVFAWLDIFSGLPSLIHALLLVLFLVAFLVALWHGSSRWTAATVDDGLGRLERDSQLRHQALRALGDQLPEDEAADPTTAALWRAHRRRLVASLEQVRLAAPRSPMPSRDPFAFRVLALLLLVVALVSAHGDYLSRLTAALRPWQTSVVPHLDPAVSLWVTPPDYTRRPPLLAEQTAGLDALEMPTGSQILLQVHHLPTDLAEGLRITLGDKPLKVEQLGDGSVELRQALDAPGRLAIRLADGQQIRAWDMRVIGDQPPKIAFDGKPVATARGVMHLQYDASDDYGLATIQLDMSPPDDAQAVEHFPLAKLSAQPMQAKNAAYLDLTAHPRAGLPMRLTLEATDGKGQAGRSETIDLVLPERSFRHPLARAVIAERKRLVADPGSQEEVAAKLSDLGASELAQTLGPGVPLSLHVTGRRVAEAGTLEERQAVIGLLWELALFIEDGGLSSAEREMRALQEKLQQALDQNADDKELNELAEQLQQTMDRYLDELQKKATEQAQNMTPEQRQQLEQMRQQGEAQAVDRQDLQKMLDQARQMMRGGAKDQAKEMLSQLQEMLENLQAQNGQPQPPSDQEKSLSDLQKMIKMQQQLMDRSFDMQRRQQQEEEQLDEDEEDQDSQQMEGQQSAQPDRQAQAGRDGQRNEQQQTGRSAAEQEALRRALGELMRRMGEQGTEIPRALGQAEMQMRDARDNLKGGMPGDAAESQSQALDLMEQGGQAMMQQLQQQAGNQPGKGKPNAGASMMPGQQGRDPLGRAQYNNGGNDPQGAAVPEDNGAGRAREVLEQLYRRSGERSRPSEELEYYNRLLDRF
ncbi:TIGR02302 family protein [Arboricoccus pini]|nr:TIGR02302 family protein [Arboricoccus pini]